MMSYKTNDAVMLITETISGNHHFQVVNRKSYIYFVPQFRSVCMRGWVALDVWENAEGSCWFQTNPPTWHTVNCARYFAWNYKSEMLLENGDSNHEQIRQHDFVSNSINYQFSQWTREELFHQERFKTQMYIYEFHSTSFLSVYQYGSLCYSRANTCFILLWIQCYIWQRTVTK